MANLLIHIAHIKVMVRLRDIMVNTKDMERLMVIHCHRAMAHPRAIVSTMNIITIKVGTDSIKVDMDNIKVAMDP